MKKFLLIGVIIVSGTIILVSCVSLGKNSNNSNSIIKPSKVHTFVYFSPEVYPDIEEIKAPTNIAYFSAVSDELQKIGNSKLLRVNIPQKFDSVDIGALKEYCKNNEAAGAVVSRVKYFKVGIGKYVFSNQVVISQKMYDANGNFVTETSYDTYRAKARMLGSAENSIKIGTAGSLHKLHKQIRTGIASSSGIAQP